MVELRLVETLYEKNLMDAIITKHHSYVPNTHTVGRHIDWLIYNDDKLIGAIGIGSATYPPCKDTLNYLSMSKDEYKGVFNNIANNWRFCLIDKIPNIGTQVLKSLRKQAKIEWKNKYGDDLYYLTTFVGSGHNGAVYRADNWKCIGQTSGLPKHKSVSMKWDSKESLKTKFVKPTGENRKLIFIIRI